MDSQESVNIFFVNLKFLRFGIYLKYFLYLFDAVVKDIIYIIFTRFPHVNYECLHVIADFKVPMK